MRGGARADVTPTILARLGVDTGAIMPPLDGESLTKAATRPAEPVVQGAPRKGGARQGGSAKGAGRKGGRRAVEKAGTPAP